jgi:hypothetical protein
MWLVASMEPQYWMMARQWPIEGNCSFKSLTHTMLTVRCCPLSPSPSLVQKKVPIYTKRNCNLVLQMTETITLWNEAAIASETSSKNMEHKQAYEEAEDKLYIYTGVPGGMCQTSGGCSLW